jgi:hypothetical protein
VIRTRGKSSRKVSETSCKAIKKQVKENAGAERRAATKKIAPHQTLGPRSLTGRDARKEERFRELVAWHMLQNVDEATARQRAQEEMDDGPRKDRPRMGGNLRVRTGERK